MSWYSTGADVGTMVTGASALTAVIVWGRNQVRQWRETKAQREYRYWNGYIIQEGIFTGFVRLVPNTDDATPERVTLDVINADGSADVQMAHRLRQIIESDKMISRSPSVEQQAFLQDLRRKRFGMPTGYPVQ